MAPSFQSGVQGPGHLRMRLVTVDDAEYIYNLRMDPAYNTYLSAVSGGVDGQRRWIESYKAEEAAGLQYYFVMEAPQQQRCGLVRLYNFEDDAFTWGSWILDHNKPPKAALESAFLIYDIAFRHLNVQRAIFEVMLKNDHTLSFHRRYGARETCMDEINVYFEYTSEQFGTDRAHIISTLKAS